MLHKMFSLLALFFLTACSLIIPNAPAPTPIIIIIPATPAAVASPSAVSASPTRVGPVSQANTPPPTALATITTVAVVPIPVSTIQIEGVPYKSYQMPGDPYRIVCQEPCTLDLQYIFASYTGFHLAHPLLIKLTGIDTLTELQPVDLHLDLQDNICRIQPGGHAGMYSRTRKAYTCVGPTYYPKPEEVIRMAARPDGQYFNLHEYMHTIFFGRISGKAGDFQDFRAEAFHDFVTPLPSFAIGIRDTAAFCSYRGRIEDARGDYPEWLIFELCRQNGFQLTHLSSSLIELDKLYQSGGGQIEQGFTHRSPTVAQYRDILSRLLGSDTTKAFLAACWPAAFFGDSATPLPPCRPALSSGTPTRIK